MKNYIYNNKRKFQYKRDTQTRVFFFVKKASEKLNFSTFVTILQCNQKNTHTMGLMMAEYYKHPERFKREERIKKVLYIYGYGGSQMSSSVEKLRSALPEDKFEVICWNYPQRECRAAIRFLEQRIKKHHIDIVVGSSLGAFVAMCLKVKCRKIIINPCLVPTMELPKLKPLPGKPMPTPQLIATYAPYEPRVFDNLPEGSHCFMAEHDELLSSTYRTQMETHMPVTTIPGGHRLSEEALPIIKEVLICNR